MPQIGVDAIADLTSFGSATGSIWCVVPPTTFQHYTSTSLSVGSGMPALLDFQPKGASVGVAFSATISAGGVNEPFNIPIGSSGKAFYVSNMGQLIQDSWVRTS